MDLRGKYPVDTFQYLVTTDGNQLFTGTGSLITSLIVTNITSSFVTQSFVSESFVHAIRIDTENITASLLQLPNYNNNILYADAVGNIGVPPVGIDIPITASWADKATTSSFMNRFSLAYNTSVIYDADVSLDVIGFALHPSKGIHLFYEDTSSNVTSIMRTIGSQSIWAGIQTFNTASGYWHGNVQGTADTSSYINYTTSSIPPINSSSVAAWLNVTVNGSIFKLPLYQ